MTAAPRDDRSRPRAPRRALLALVAAVTAVTGSLAPSGVDGTERAEAAADDVVALVIEGTGYGHGRGMSQWGAYGYAVDHGWTWQRILDRYFGGTVASSAPPGQRIRVRLTRFDGLEAVGVVSRGAGVTWGGVTAPAMRAVRTGDGTFAVDRADRVACPGASALTVPDGPVLRGSTDSAAVRRIQAFLDRYHDPAMVVDGQWGPKTAGIVASWQTSRRLPVDGDRWDADDAAEARRIVAADASSVRWTRVGTHAQRPGTPLRFTTPGGDDAGTAPGDVLGVCTSTGSIGHHRGAIEVVATGAGTRVVNDVAVEQYLRGVVPREIAASWAHAGDGAGAHAVRAQAVAARSYGLAQQRAYTYDGSSVRYATTCDTTSCQVYGGAANRSSVDAGATSVEHPATDAAIAATAGVVRTWPSGSRAGRVVSTEFSASNGPRTAGGAFPPIDDAGDDTARNPNHRWTRVIDARAFARAHGLGTITSVSMEPTARAGYGGFDGIWYDDLVVTGTTGTYRRQAWDVRGELGLRSPGFTVRAVRADTSARTMAFVGDSVGAGVAAPGEELRTLTEGTYASRSFDAVEGRCTTRAACPGTSGVEAARGLPTGLDLVVVELGYNDDPSGFAGEIDAMMAALAERDVRQVAWVNLADIRTSGGRSVYAPANAALDAAAGRWPNLTVLDWDGASRGPERVRWFSDGVHLTATGQAELAVWLREQMVALAPSRALAPPARLEVPVVGERLRGPDGAELVVPDDATGVALNVTVVRPVGRGFATVWPCGAERPVVSSVNVEAGDVVANSVIAPVSGDGTVCLFSSVGTHVVVDVMGWFSGATGGGADPFVGMTPRRLVDTRAGTGAPARRVTPGAPLRIPVAGATGQRPGGGAVTVPDDVAAVAVNLTVVRADGRGFATVWPCGTAMPVASNANFEAGRVVANGVVAPVGDDGSICVHVSSPADVLVDLAGSFDGGAAAGAPAFRPATPTRLVDTRAGVGTPAGRRGPSSPLSIPVRGVALRGVDGGPPEAVPADASAVALNLTVVQGAARGYATVWPCGTERPLASNLNFLAGENRANAVVAPIGDDGRVCVHVDTSAHVVVDVAGWFRGGDAAAFRGAVPKRLVDTRAGHGPTPS